MAIHQTRRMRSIDKNIMLPNTQESFGPIESFRDITIVPYEVIIQRGSATPFENKGGPIFPDWDQQIAARFCQSGTPVDTLPETPNSISEHIDAPAVWCGPCCTHFGHQITDFSTRILQGVTAYPGARFLFAPATDSGIKTLDDTPDFFRAILDWYGVPSDQVTLITKPTQVSELHVPPQAEQLFDAGPSSAYLDSLDRIVEQNFGEVQKTGIIYVSRAGQPYCMAGESYLEALFREVGIEVMRPETLPLQDQLQRYYAARHLIFSEGSALHGLQLLGRSVGDVTLIQRRPKLRLSKESFQRRADKFDCLNLLAGLVHGLRINGRERLHQALSIFDEALLLDFLGSIDPQLVARRSIDRYREARDQDIKRWIDVESRNPASQAPNSTKTVILRLQELHLDHMIPLVKERLPDC